MRSHVHFKSHPLHPILVSFPIAYFTGVLLAHAAGLFFNMPGLLAAAYYLNMGGILFALLAAIPGFIDFLKVVPPKSSGKKRAAKHGIINVLVLLIFSGAFIYRRTDEPHEYLLLAMELTGVILLSIAGWMGGTLVYRNQIAVDHRYANAGKWKEQYFKEQTGRIEVATAKELKINAMKLLHVNDKRIVLARTEKGFVAFDDHCPHKGGPLSDGSLACSVVQCPWHGSQFSVEDGSLKAGPAKEGIKTYLANREGEKIFLML
ncbi:MAG: hypothetical protein C4308_13460 [Chitinophagaceae bacterium]